jgi:ATP-binding cassette, subfamily B, bacterial PglK
MKILKKFHDLLTPPEFRRAGLLLVMILIMALIDTLGVASIMPFMAVLTNPQLVETNAFLAAAYQVAVTLGVATIEQFLFALGVLVFLVLITSLAIKAVTLYVQLRFSLMREYSLGKRLVEGYLHQPYSWFLNRNSTDLGKNILSEVGTVINSGLMPLLNLFAQSAVSIALITLLIIIDPILALSVAAFMATLYGGIFMLMRGFLLRIGADRVQVNEERYTVVNEAFGAAKEVKVRGLELSYIRRFAKPAQTYANHLASVQVISQLPRFLFEGFAFGGMILLVLVLMRQSDNLASALPIIVVYAFAGYRLMPALHQIYTALTTLRFVGPALDALHKDLMSLQPAEQLHNTISAMPLTQAIELKNIHFSYPNAPQPTLKGISLTIPAHSTVALVGPTGSGKTTTVDLILGLLDAQQGTLVVDGNPINSSNRSHWQHAIGYVPQQIYLADNTVAANIAFGVGTHTIDQASVERVAKIANLHDFVINDLPKGYQTTVGERGVRLSGGQRQRIGIARALYHNPHVLILDEATSALDNLTEREVMEAINNLGQEITIILIAHRLSTVLECETIFLLEKGKLKGQGSFEELTQKNKRFSDMATTL